MTLHWLSQELVFPPVEYSNKDGMLAVGGDLSVERLVLAYQSGIFPWYNEGEPVIWWSPDPRFILYPKDIKLSRSMKKLMNKNIWRITFDQSFAQVIRNCQVKRDDTWITNDIISSYCELHEQGYAHSVEVWQEDKLVGGLYGISLGRCFFGESMFSHVRNSSKAALITLAQKLAALDFHLIDCQVYTAHLESMGAQFISRKNFIQIINEGFDFNTIQKKWNFLNV